MIAISALNVLIIGLASIVFNFVWRMAAGWMEDRNSDFAGAMGVLN